MISSSSGTEPSSNCFDNSVWYLDTRASNHMCKDVNFFRELSKVKVRHMSFGDASKVAV